MINVNEIIGQYDVVLVTLDTLRYDVAQGLFEQGNLPNFQKCLPKQGWEKRHAPGSFTYASHHAIFACFFPTPLDQPKADRLFATRFAGSETSTDNTFVFDEATIVEGLKKEHYHTACIGGVGFFNKQTALSRVFPELFDESHWCVDFGVTQPDSTKNQFEKAREIVKSCSTDRLFLFVNVSAMHQPNCYYLDGVTEDSLESHGEALKYVDRQLPILMNAFKGRPTIFLFMSDHGTTYGEDGYSGHRLAHELVWNVPYAEFIRSAD